MTCRRLLTVLLVLLMQGPALVVQEAAWVGMLVDYTRERGLRRGLIETFDGEHPCCLCKKAAKLREREHRSDPGESRADPLGARLAWAEMIPCAIVQVPAAMHQDQCGDLSAPVLQLLGRAADAPPSPPPERV